MLAAAIVGFGVIGRVHVRTLSALSGVTVGCVVDPDPDARGAARALGHRTYGDVGQMVGAVAAGELRAPDLVVVAAPTSAHVSTVEALLETTGASILCEKPLTDDPDDLDLLMARDGADRRLRVVNHFGFSPEVEWAVRLVDGRGWGPPDSVVSVFNDPYVIKTPHQRASYVSSWIDSAPNQLGLLARFVTDCRVVAHDGAPDGTRSATQVAFASGSGTLVSNWHTGASSKQTTLRWADGREVWLDHTAMTCVAMEGGAAVAHLGNEATLERKDAHYQAMYRAYFDDVDHVLLSPGFARVVAHLLRQAHHLKPGDRLLRWDTM